MLHHHHCRFARDRMVDMEVMKLERRNARLRSEQARRATDTSPQGRPAPRYANPTGR